MSSGWPGASRVGAATSGAIASMALPPAAATAVEPEAISGVAMGRAPVSSGRRRCSRTPLNHEPPRVKCQAEEIENSRPGVSASWTKNTRFASRKRVSIVTMR